MDGYCQVEPHGYSLIEKGRVIDAAVENNGGAVSLQYLITLNEKEY